MTAEQRQALVKWVDDFCGDQFDASWAHLEIHGVCDALGGLEWYRVKREWQDYLQSSTQPGRGGTRNKMAAGRFIAERANILADSPSPCWTRDGTQ